MSGRKNPITRSLAKANEALRQEVENFNPFLTRSQLPRSPDASPNRKSIVETSRDEPLEAVADGSSSNPPLPLIEETQSRPEEPIVGDLISLNSNNSDSSSVEGADTDDSQKTLRPPSDRGGNNMAPPEVQLIKVKDAVAYVPQFDGHNIPLNEFLEACKEAKGMVNSASESALVRLIKTKITGEARRTMPTKKFETIDALIKHFKDLYDSGETLQQLLGKLGYEIQRDHEGVIPFANRLREIGSRVFEARKGSDGEISEDAKREVENCIIDSFKKGLRPEIEARLPANIVTDEVIKEAVKIERQLKNREALLATVTKNDTKRKAVLAHQNYTEAAQNQGGNYKSNCSFCKKSGHNEENCFAKARATQTKTCQLCNGIGHVATGCHKFVKCQLCDKPGHKANECYQYKGAANNGANRLRRQCQVCHKIGHEASTCFQAHPDLAALECSFCKRKGHSIENCKTRQNLIKNDSGNEKSLLARSADKETHQTRSLNVAEFDNLLCELLPLD